VDTFPLSPYPAPDPRPALVKALADQFRAMLDTAEALAKVRRTIHLGGLDSLAGKLCAASLDLAPEHRAAMVETLNDLLDRLDSLEAAMRPEIPAPRRAGA
jgi:hypothetical protein